MMSSTSGKVGKQLKSKITDSVPVPVKKPAMNSMTNVTSKKNSEKNIEQSTDDSSTSSSETDSETEQNSSILIPLKKKATNDQKKDVVKDKKKKDSELSTNSKQVPLTPASNVNNENTFASEDNVELNKLKSPQLSSTVIKTGKNDLLSVPEGISPITMKTKTQSKPLNYFDKMMSKS